LRKFNKYLRISILVLDAFRSITPAVINIQSIFVLIQGRDIFFIRELNPFLFVTGNMKMKANLS